MYPDMLVFWYVVVGILSQSAFIDDSVNGVSVRFEGATDGTEKESNILYFI